MNPKPMTPVFYDCEFHEDGSVIDLISIGMVAGSREYYAVNSDADWTRIFRHTWLMRNVVPSLPLQHRESLDAWLARREHPSHPPPAHLSMVVDKADSRVKPHWVIANEVRDFILATPDPQLWAWYGSYDHVAYAQLFGRMINLPDGLPKYTNELKQECDRLGNPRVPQQAAGQHNALEDARHNRVIYEFLLELEAGQAGASGVGVRS